MITLYWIWEYIKVFAVYMLVMYVWPLTVFRGFLKGKSRTVRFAFCVTVQVVLINSAVLLLGLLHLLNAWVVRLLFYGVFLVSVFWKVRIGKEQIKTVRHLVSGTYGRKLFLHNTAGELWEKAKKQLSGLWKSLKGRRAEYFLLAVIVLFGMIYFTYGAFSDYSYGFGDMYVHNEWIYALTQGQIFSDGVYPEAMHVMIYALHTLFGVRIYSILLFLAGIQSSIFLISAYVLLRELFRWRFTPLLALTGFLTIDVTCIDMVYSMSRLQWTIPQEYALYTQFLGAAFLIRYLRSEHYAVWKGKTSKRCWDVNLLVFMLAIAASLAIHFYVTIMTFFLCICIVPFMFRRIFSRKRFLPLVAACVCGFLIAVLPMGGALLSGIPFQGSIDWAVSVINGTENESTSTDTGAETNMEEEDDVTTSAESESGSGTGSLAEESGGAGEVSAEEEETSLAEKLKAYAVSLPERLSGVYWDSYVTLYGLERADILLFMVALAAGLWLVYRIFATILHWIPACKKVKPGYFDKYPALILASLVFMVMYWPDPLGLPSLVAGSRLCSTVQLLNLAVIAIPVDMVMSLAALLLPQLVLKAAGVLSVFGVYAGTILTGTFHGYLYYELTRYNGAVMATYSITKTLPECSYTIVSPVDEIYQVIQFGYHEELINFVNHSADADYTLPSEYVFIFVEKHPIEYAQSHFFTGPSWLACEKYADYYSSVVSQCPDISSLEIAEELVADRTAWFVNSSAVYSNLESRTVLESTAYAWCLAFDEAYPNELQVYYEDDDFICYYFRQNTKSVYSLGLR